MGTNEGRELKHRATEGTELKNAINWRGIMELNELSHAVIGAAIEVHRHLGPGLLETAYRKCLA
jgi:hypothetical protein